ncbi:class I SAM-dependent methyltransferase [Clostridium frigidicarnis]|uniref:Ubiquinone/menaquinone biosynthesis C-methylase UbiE n=1 Tax=Clostridium frigidicarnis TaxID=84698 RepID=A0A1I0Y9I3_9CLOT|nr:class I SAM-dependent methyltransferase [Clostridium frigidicarnis]SFB10009.1 Ubiquinone/menaquinone biosynthesis C-methylase UbiE [Clostridium frigidicarnis]
MDKKYLFDKIVLNYEKRRPNYGSKVFQDIINYSGLTKDKSIIEVGCGTGQATEPFLKTQCRITAVELGENLGLYTKKKFKDYTNLEVIISAFEDYKFDDNKFDMLYSATAFHWIPAEIGYKKSYRIIKSGGALALFWNKASVKNKDNIVHRNIQSIYDEFLPQWSKKAINNEDKYLYSSIINEIKKCGFIDIEFKTYHNTRVMTGVEYIELLNTYSDHIALDESIRIPLFKAIRDTIEELGDEIIINDTVELYLARKD